MEYGIDRISYPLGLTMKNIKSILDASCSHLKIDDALLKSIHEYRIGFVNRNPDHVAFFGGNLLGVHPIRFRNADLNEWYDSVLGIDDIEVRSQILKLPTINPEWVRGTDVMNLSCLWLVHRFATSSLSAAKKHQGMIDALMVLHYKFITSLMAHYFPYPADKSVALATYAALTKKYALKVYGSWNAMLIARCEDIVSRSSIHLKTINTFNDDGKIQYLVTDTQGRLRSIIKKMRGVFETIRQQDAKIHTTKMTGMDMEGKQILKDLTRNYTPFKRYLHEIASDAQRLIKPELVSVIADAMYTMPPEMLIEVLEYVAKHYGKDKIDIEALLDEIVLHAVEYLSEEQSSFLKTQDFATLITRLRANYMSSRSTDPSLLKIRQQTETLVKAVIKSKNPSVIAAVRTGFALYIVLVTFSMRNYV